MNARGKHTHKHIPGDDLLRKQKGGRVCCPRLRALPPARPRVVTTNQLVVATWPPPRSCTPLDRHTTQLQHHPSLFRKEMTCANERGHLRKFKKTKKKKRATCMGKTTKNAWAGQNNTPVHTWEWLRRIITQPCGAGGNCCVGQFCAADT